MIPDSAAISADVYKAGALAGHLWRVGEEVTLDYVRGYVGPAIATSLPTGQRAVSRRFEVPAFFAGLLPEGATRRRNVARELHVAEDDELGLLAGVGADAVGDVQVMPKGVRPPVDRAHDTLDVAAFSLAELMRLPGRVEDRSIVAGVQPKISHQSRSVIGGSLGHVILKLSPDDAWRGVLENERLFLRLAPNVGLRAPTAEIVVDRNGVSALAVVRFDRSMSGGSVIRHAQEDAAQVLGIRPAQKYDPDARTVINALADACSAPAVAARDLLHQLLYSYAIGNNDVHAKNLSIGQDPRTGIWSVTPVYDVLHTWPYESDHRFHPAVREAAHDTVTRKHWMMLATEVGVPDRVVARLMGAVHDAVGALVPGLDETGLGMPPTWVRDVRRRVTKRVRDLS